MQSAEYEDRSLLASLKIEQQTILTSIKNREGSIRSKVQKLALLIEERLRLADPTLEQEGMAHITIEQISTRIGRMLLVDAPSTAANVYHYLTGEDPNGRPYSRFKDPMQQRNVTEDRSKMYCEPVEELIMLTKQERDLIEGIKGLKNDEIYSIYELKNKIGKICEKVADSRGFLLPGHENREWAKTPKDEPRPTRVSEEWRRFAIDADRIAEFTEEYPPPTTEMESKFAAGIAELRRTCVSTINEKRALTIPQWYTRVKYMIQQSKHGAAVKDMQMTMICQVCWDYDKGEERPNCNAEMVWDSTSPTNWRCTSCGGVRGKWQGITREQCGDNKAPILTQAENFVNNIPGFYEWLDYMWTVPQVRIASRRVKLHGDFSKKA